MGNRAHTGDREDPPETRQVKTWQEDLARRLGKKTWQEGPARRPGKKAWQETGKKIRKEDQSEMKGFKNFLMQGDLVVVAVGLVAALAFSTLVKAFTDNVITPLVNAAGGGGSNGAGLGWTIN